LASIIAKRYAKALFDLAQDQKNLEAMQADVSWVKQTFESQPQLENMLLLPNMPKEEKKQVLKAIADGSVSEPMLGLLYLLVDKGRILYLPEILKEYQRLYQEETRVAEVSVKSAAALTQEDESQIRTALEKALKRQVILHAEVSPELIGGLVVRVGDQVFDNSLRTKLQNMKKDLLQKKISQEVAR
jgi:F-type H+-transporting ATPase subunit delta